MALLLLACLIAPQDPALDKKVAALIQRLGSDDLDERENAQKELNSLGASVKARIEAAIPGASPEVAARLRALLDNFAWEDRFKNSLAPVLRLTLDKKKRTLEDILAVVREKTGWTVRVAAMNLREPVELGWTDAPALQVLDDVCRALGRGRVEAPLIAGDNDRHPRFEREDSGGNAITIDGGEKAAPAAGYWNQFRAEVAGITIVETRNYSSTESTASLSLQLSAQPGVSVMKAGNWIIDEITDDRGKSLKSDAKTSPFAKRETEPGDARDSVWFARDDLGSFEESTLDFEVPGPGSTRIAVLKARIRVTLPGKKVTEIRKVADVREGGEIRLGDAVITISKAGMEEGEFKMTYRAGGKHQGTPSFELLDADGRQVRTSGSGTSSNGATTEAEWRVSGEVAAVRVSAILGHRTIEIPFELKDIPLPKGD